MSLYNLLNFLRWLGAFFVVIGHLRSFIFVNYHQVESHTLLTKIFYFLTGFGHQGVVMFFVISGYLVGGTVLNKYITNGYLDASFIKLYSIKRFSRIYVVLVPAIVIGFIFDLSGIYLFENLYRNAYRISAMDLDVTETITALNFIGNIFNVQTILTDPLGTALPTWSLANEWWYYFLFPLIFINNNTKILFLLLVIGLFFLNQSIVEYSLLWLIGALTFQLKRKLLHIYIAILILSTFLVISRIYSGFYIDVLVGLSIALLINSSTFSNSRIDLFARFNSVFAEFSYSLYLLHFPLIVLMISIAHFYKVNLLLLDPSFTSFGVWFSLLFVVYVYSFVMYMIFEKNSSKVRDVLVNRWLAVDKN